MKGCGAGTPEEVLEDEVESTYQKGELANELKVVVVGARVRARQVPPPPPSPIVKKKRGKKAPPPKKPVSGLEVSLAFLGRDRVTRIAPFSTGDEGQMRNAYHRFDTHFVAKDVRDYLDVTLVELEHDKRIEKGQARIYMKDLAHRRPTRRWLPVILSTPMGDEVSEVEVVLRLTHSLELATFLLPDPIQIDVQQLTCPPSRCRRIPCRILRSNRWARPAGASKKVLRGLVSGVAGPSSRHIRTGPSTSTSRMGLGKKEYPVIVWSASPRAIRQK
mmetsp:Transcript_27392/g.82938  ORF Transcript_27392/g.82938 Transcript_27392/m.82938 type:complete len:275 (+) Transcript_27392:3633-4457(+)